uniref:Protein kinase domain-containing protein n=1 Tax=Panagrellus redivivus TaxID=6233 RepID=A0A7E4VHF8_PANRE
MMQSGFGASTQVRKRKAPASIPTQTVDTHLEKGPADCVDLFCALQDEEEHADEYGAPNQGHMAVEIGQTVAKRYFVVRKAGFGHSAVAWLAFDKKVRKFCVLKIFKQDASSIATEIQVLKEAKRLKQRPGGDKVVQMFETFNIYKSHKRILHHGIAFEPCGFTLLSVMNQSKSGFEIPAVRKLLQHCLEGLRFIQEDLGYIHGDIKPENILVSATDRSFFLETQSVVDAKYNGHGMRAAVNQNLPFVPSKTTATFFKTILSAAPAPSEEDLPEMSVPRKQGRMVPPRYTDLEKRLEVNRLLMWSGTIFKICDIGNVMKPGVYQVNAGTYDYRPPENLFSEELSGTFDVWGLGATALETILLEQIFQPHHVPENVPECPSALLRQMVNVLGLPPAHLWPNLVRPEGRSAAKPVDVAERIMTRVRRHGFRRNEVLELCQIIARMLSYDKDARISVSDALALPFFGN